MSVSSLYSAVSFRDVFSGDARGLQVVHAAISHQLDVVRVLRRWRPRYELFTFIL